MSISPVTTTIGQTNTQSKVQPPQKKALSLAQITRTAKKVTSDQVPPKKMISDNLLGKTKTLSKASGQNLKTEIKEDTHKAKTLGRKFLASVSDSLLNKFRANKVREEVKTSEPIYKGLASYIATQDREQLCKSSCLTAIEQDVRSLEEKCFFALRKLFVSTPFRFDLQLIVNKLGKFSKEKIGGELFILIWSNSFGSLPPSELAGIKSDILKLCPIERGFLKSDKKTKEFEELALFKDRELRFALFAFSHLILPLFSGFIEAEIKANQNTTAPAIKELLDCLSHTLPKIDEMPTVY